MQYLFLCSLLFSTVTFAFNGRKCDTLISRKGGFYLLPMSTAQFTSSTGECSALGMNKEDQRKLFYYVNFEPLKNDVARGNGETLNSLLSLSGCKNFSDFRIKKKMKENYAELFNEDSEKSYLNVSPMLDSFCGEQKVKS
jgi:hypothetical protein